MYMLHVCRECLSAQGLVRFLNMYGSMKKKRYNQKLKQASPCVFEYTYEYIKVSITKNSYEDYYMSMDGSTLCSICFITGFPFG